MNKLYYLISLFLFILIILLLQSIFFGNNSFKARTLLEQENNEQIKENNDLKEQNEILEFEIKNAQSSNEHIENFAREKLNLTYPDEEFIIFEEQKNADEE
ncbi:septum formation initiator family protein [SAR86 cluster bacterium]|jgi:cell division protein FtsB|nr:septum formation initiator family protein [SAR86 cluster bacterium]